MSIDKEISDKIQNEMIVIGHHVEDIIHGVQDGDKNYAMKGLNDIKEALGRMSIFITPKQMTEVERIAGAMDD